MATQAKTDEELNAQAFDDWKNSRKTLASDQIHPESAPVRPKSAPKSTPDKAPEVPESETHAASEAAEPSVPVGSTGESARPPEGRNPRTEDSSEPPRSTAESRIKGLQKDLSSKEKELADAKKLADDAKAESERIRREAAEARAEIERLKAAAQAPPVQSVKTAEQKPEEPVDPKPKLADFLKNAKKDETYEEINERYVDSLIDWRERQRAAAEQKTRRETAATEAQRRYLDKIDQARAKFSDFDAWQGNVRLHPPIMRALVLGTWTTLGDGHVGDVTNGMEVCRHLALNAAEGARVAALPPMEQLLEVRIISRELSRNAATSAAQPPSGAEVNAATPRSETQPQPTFVSSLPKPARALNGNSQAPPEDPSEFAATAGPDDLEKWKDLKRRRRVG
jgi:hypothetical protein